MKTLSTGLERIATGTSGLDEIAHGGIPKGRTTLIMGEAGAGKTVLTLQVLANSTREDGATAIFVGFEEDAAQLAANASSFDWQLTEVLSDKLIIVNARPHPDVVLAGNFDLSGLLLGIKHKADQVGATIVAFDSLDVVLSMLDDRIAERRELYRIHEWLSTNGYTGILTAKLQEASQDGSNGHRGPALSNRYVFLEFMADCVISLTRRVRDHVTLRTLRILKYRGSGFDENEFPFTITKSGLELCKARRWEYDVEAKSERISSGVADLDHMLEGGFFRGSSVLFTGDSGSGRTAFAAAFADAACRRGEPTLFIGFGESPAEMIQCLARTGIHFDAHIKRGILHLYDATPDDAYGEMHTQRVQELVAQYRPRCLVIDPLSAATTTGGPVHASRVAERLITFAKGEDITALYTCLPQQIDAAVALEPLPVVTFIDTWIHLTNTVEEGERSRLLTVVKSRGTFAATTMREIIRSSDGIALRNVYVRGQRVLTGRRRLEEEARHRAQIALWQREIEVMSAQLLADKLALESLEGNEPVGLTGETRSGNSQEPMMHTRTARKRSRKKGGTE